MYIKQLIIQGFKTYKDRTVIDEFSPHVNIILGKNGAGKSNLLDAIQFVLSDKYQNLRTEERQRLLYEGTGREVLSASVEIIFDNTDKRFTTEGDVSIKRTIGLKKDEYFIDNKHCTKQEIINILESVGLSRSNPYYIVEQGKINALIRMKDAERLDLLREIAGTKTYDERKKESLKIMKDTDYKVTQVNDVIVFLNERIDELHSEKNELQEYQKLDNERRALEYCIYDHELQSAVRKLDTMENQRNNTDDTSNKIYLELNQINTLKTNTTNQISEYQAELIQEQNILKQYNTNKRQLMEERTNLELNINEYNTNNEQNTVELQQKHKQLQQLNKEIANVEKQLNDATNKYNAALQAEQTEQQRLTALEQRLQNLFTKQNNKTQYKTKKQRDTDLTNKINDLKQNIRDVEKQINALNKERTTVQSKMEQTNKLITEKHHSENELTQALETDQYQYNTLKTERNELIDQLKATKTQLYEIQKQYNHCDTKLQIAEQLFNKSIDLNSLQGMNTLKTVVEKYNIQGVHGHIIDLFTTEQTFYRCIEITARNSLFNVVVDNDTIATQIIQYIQNDDLRGRLTFIPLNQLPRFVDTQYPDSSDILPMISKLKFDTRYRAAIQQIFGDTVIARDLTVASNMALQHNLNAITLHGDQIDKSGGITGGLLGDKYGNKINNYMTVKQIRTECNKLKTQKTDLETSVNELEQKLRTVEQQITQLVHKRTVDKERIIETHKQILYAQETLKTLQNELTDIDTTLNKLNDNKTALQTQIQYYESEIQSPFTSDLSPEELNELNDKIAQQSTIKANLVKLHQATVTAELQRNQYSSQLNDNLLKQRLDLQQEIDTLESEINNQITLDTTTDKLEQYTQQITDIEQQIKSIQKEIKHKQTKLNELNEQLESYKQTETEIKNKLNNMNSYLDTILNKKQLYQRKKDECQRKIKDLSTISLELINTHKNKDNKRLIAELERINSKLVKLKHVNKKAATQYNLFNEQKETLQNRKNELEEGRQAILRLMDHLDLKKDEAINRTFKAIAKHFTMVFAELVPGGKATLVIQTRPTDEMEVEEKSEESKHDTGDKSASYTGVGIQVKFPGGAGESGGLSGGQESVVALSLIFAIQRCDPSPFYIFDEIDSALDPQHRAAVSKMLGQQSAETQFIATTFHPEMLEVADKYYGVVFHNKASRVNVINRKQANDFMAVIETAAEEEPHSQYTETDTSGYE